MRTVIALLATILLTATPLLAREPLYVVNGAIVPSIKHIPHEDIERIDVLPADEDTIAKWGPDASDGVILVTLRYDTPASFSHGDYDNFTNYLADHIKWGDTMPTERVSLRIVVTKEGKATISEVLEATSLEFLRKVRKAICIAPLWSPAERNGATVESTHLVNIQLPKGKMALKEVELIIR
ncbi:MAG: TonB-dependent receptor [Alistipes sp.]|nr:TonB-dependent receptor [Alistipes sp.]